MAAECTKPQNSTQMAAECTKPQNSTQMAAECTKAQNSTQMAAECTKPQNSTQMAAECTKPQNSTQNGISHHFVVRQRSPKFWSENYLEGWRTWKANGEVRDGGGKNEIVDDYVQ